MRVFPIILFSFIVLIVVFCTSSIKIRVKHLNVNECSFKNLSHDEVNFIFYITHAIQDKKYVKLLDFFDTNISVNLLLFSIVPIKVCSIDNSRLKSIFEKQQKKYNNLKCKNICKYNKKKDRNKIIQTLMINNSSIIKISNVHFNVNLGLENASYTAIMCGVINLILTIVLLASLSPNSNLPKIAISEDMIAVHPIYNNKLFFSSSLKMDITFKLFSIVNIFISSVNNTRKNSSQTIANKVNLNNLEEI